MPGMVPYTDDRPSVREDGPGSRLDAILRVIVWMIAIGAVPPIVHNVLAGRWSSAGVLLAAEAGVFFGALLGRRGRRQAAVYVVVTTVQVCAAALVVVGRLGFHDVAMLLFPATLVVAGLLLNLRAFAAVAAATLLFVVGIGVAELVGIHVTPLTPFTYGRNVLDAAIILGVTAVTVGLLAASVRASLAQAHRNEATAEAARGALAEQAARLQASEELFRSLVDLAVDGIIIGDVQGRIVRANNRIVEMSGFTAAELAGRRMDDLFHREAPSREPPSQDLVIRSETLATERLLRRKDGTTVPVEMSAKRMPDGTCHAFFRDVTERRRAEEEKARLQDELRQAQKMEAVGRLAGGIAHDFNNMLMVISSSVAVALRDVEAGSRAGRCLEQVEHAAGRAAALTRQLLTFSRKQAISPRVLDLGELVENLRPMLAGAVGRGVAVDLALPRGLGLVKVDAAQIEQAVLNLAMNARDAMPRGGRLSFSLSRVDLGGEAALSLALAAGPYVALGVTDDGSGIADEVRQHLFEPFFTTKPTGTGLGLAMVYGAVKQNQGAIEVDSRPGTGTTFRLFFPCVAADVDERRPGHRTA